MGMNMQNRGQGSGEEGGHEDSRRGAGGHRILKCHGEKGGERGCENGPRGRR